MCVCVCVGLVYGCIFWLLMLSFMPRVCASPESKSGRGSVYLYKYIHMLLEVHFLDYCRSRQRAVASARNSQLHMYIAQVMPPTDQYQSSSPFYPPFLGPWQFFLAARQESRNIYLGLLCPNNYYAVCFPPSIM